MKKTLKLARKHPNQKMNLGRHIITNIAHTYDLNEKEVKLLGTKGPSHWIKEVEAKLAKPMPKPEKEMTNKQKLIKELKEMGVKIPSKATEKELEEIMLKEINK